MVTVISLGGSIVAPDNVDVELVSGVKKLFSDYLAEDRSRKLILIVGGGAPARKYQEAFRAIEPGADNDSQDWIGIMATRLNAQLVKAVFGDLCQDDVVTDPTIVKEIKGQILVAAGWKPGFSTDFDAVVLAEAFGAKQVLNLSNIEQVYTADPKLDPSATPIEHISWTDFTGLVGDTWEPGKNLPFDPIATKRAKELGLEVIAAGGRDLDNINKILHGEAFFGTSIGPE